MLTRRWLAVTYHWRRRLSIYLRLFWRWVQVDLRLTLTWCDMTLTCNYLPFNVDFVMNWCLVDVGWMFTWYSLTLTLRWPNVDMTFVEEYLERSPNLGYWCLHNPILPKVLIINFVNVLAIIQFNVAFSIL